jgi:hypothetical protein
MNKLSKISKITTDAPFLILISAQFCLRLGILTGFPDNQS